VKIHIIEMLEVMSSKCIILIQPVLGVLPHLIRDEDKLVAKQSLQVMYDLCQL